MDDLKYNHTFDHSQITPNIYVGSDLCKGGVCKIHVEEFKKLGVSVEINLKLENNELPPNNLKSYIWLPVVDETPPSLFQFNLGTSIINEVVKAGEVVYIHCKEGQGRAPSLAAAYFIRFQKMSVSQALEIVKKGRPEINLNDLQLEALKNYSSY